MLHHCAVFIVQPHDNWLCSMIDWLQTDSFVMLSCSRTVKELRESISGAQLDAGDLEQQQQHLKRQLATLADRIKRLESQVG